MIALGGPSQTAGYPNNCELFGRACRALTLGKRLRSSIPMYRMVAPLVCLGLVATVSAAQGPTEPIDAAVNAKIRAEGMECSKVMWIEHYLADVYGALKQVLEPHGKSSDRAAILAGPRRRRIARRVLRRSHRSRDRRGSDSGAYRTDARRSAADRRSPPISMSASRRAVVCPLPSADRAVRKIDCVDPYEGALRPKAKRRG